MDEVTDQIKSWFIKYGFITAWGIQVPPSTDVEDIDGIFDQIQAEAEGLA